MQWDLRMKPKCPYFPNILDNQEWKRKQQLVNTITRPFQSMPLPSLISLKDTCKSKDVFRQLTILDKCHFAFWRNPCKKSSIFHGFWKCELDLHLWPVPTQTSVLSKAVEISLQWGNLRCHWACHYNINV